MMTVIASLPAVHHRHQVVPQVPRQVVPLQVVPQVHRQAVHPNPNNGVFSQFLTHRLVDRVFIHLMTRKLIMHLSPIPHMML